MKNNKLNKPAFVEHIILWIIMFTSFISLFFFILEYANILKMQHQLSLMSDVGAKMTSKNINNERIIESLNRLKTKNIANITTNNLNCNTNTNSANYQVTFDVLINYRNSFFNNILKRTVVFNETNSSQIDCTLTLRGTENE